MGQSLALLGELFGKVRRHRQLLVELVRRDITDKHAGQLLGPTWILGHPLLLTAIYLFLFVWVLPARGMTGGVESIYVVQVLAGLIPWLAAQDSLLRGVSSLSGNANLVKQVIFPIELLPVKGVFAALLAPIVMSTGLVIFLILSGRGITATVALVPLLWFIQIAGVTGLSLGLAAIGAYFRDLRELVQLFCLVNLYLLPVFYQPEAMPESIRFVPYANPFSYLVWCHQDAWTGTINHPIAWVLFPTFALLSLLLGNLIFQAVRPQLGNVL
jgi:lipopolysaccharide transport system permease protein